MYINIPDYQDSKIFKIYSTNPNIKEEFYGYSFDEDLMNDLEFYKATFNNNNDEHSLFKMFRKYGTQEFQIKLVERYSCKSLRELEERINDLESFKINLILK